jgi:hypothetical protein
MLIPQRSIHHLPGRRGLSQIRVVLAREALSYARAVCQIVPAGRLTR